MKTSFETRVSRMGSGSFVDINIFVLKYYLILVFSYAIFFNSLKSKSTKILYFLILLNKNLQKC